MDRRGLPTLARIAGQSIAITVDGIVATAPVINSPLLDEIVVALVGESTFETAARLGDCVKR
jgi:hypothetical protein